MCKVPMAGYRGGMNEWTHEEVEQGTILKIIAKSLVFILRAIGMGWEELQ